MLHQALRRQCLKDRSMFMQSFSFKEILGFTVTEIAWEKTKFSTFGLLNVSRSSASPSFPKALTRLNAAVAGFTDEFYSNSVQIRCDGLSKENTE